MPHFRALRRAGAFCLLSSVFCLLSPAAFGAVDGTVMNVTTGQPQAGVEVSLVHPGAGGMETLGTAKSAADGSFKIDAEIPGPPALLQGIFQDVTYNLFLQPGSPTSGVRFNVYNATKEAAVAAVAQHLIVLQPSADKLQVSETFLIQNDSNTTYQDPARGAIQFYLPKAARDAASVTVNAPGGMPIQRAPEKTKAGGGDVFTVDYPAKPGQTRYDVNYTLTTPTKFSGKVTGTAPLRLVTPSTVTLTGAGIQDLGQEPQTQAHVYQIANQVLGAAYEVDITGTGTLNLDGGSDSGDQQQQQPANSGQPPIEEGQARIYSRLYLVLGLTFAILAVGGVMLYRKGTA
jgi:hypothetical protein